MQTEEEIEIYTHSLTEPEGDQHYSIDAYQ